MGRVHWGKAGTFRAVRFGALPPSKLPSKANRTTAIGKLWLGPVLSNLPRQADVTALPKSGSGEAPRTDLSARSLAAIHIGADCAEDMLDLQMDITRHLVMGLEAVEEGRHGGCLKIDDVID